MVEYPTIVYRCPGPWVGPPGTTYDSVGVDDEASMQERLAAGWHLTLPAAIDALTVPVKVAPSGDDAPPTRFEMLLQAEVLGIAVDKRWSDKTLLAKINEAMTPN